MGATRERRLLARYRAAVEVLMEMPYDLDLLRAHMKRNRMDAHRQGLLDELARELRKQAARFREIEPVRYAELDKHLREKYEQRNALNAERSRERPLRIGDDDAEDS